MSFYQEDRPKQKRFYSSKRWRACRDVYLSTHPLCERCAQVGIASTAEHVHHKIELTEANYSNPMIALNPDNLEALCFECHRKEHHGASEVGEEYLFDEDGELVRREDFSAEGRGV